METVRVIENETHDHDEYDKLYGHISSLTDLDIYLKFWLKGEKRQGGGDDPHNMCITTRS